MFHLQVVQADILNDTLDVKHAILLLLFDGLDLSELGNVLATAFWSRLLLFLKDGRELLMGIKHIRLEERRP